MSHSSRDDRNDRSDRNSAGENRERDRHSSNRTHDSRDPTAQFSSASSSRPYGSSQNGRREDRYDAGNRNHDSSRYPPRNGPNNNDSTLRNYSSHSPRQGQSQSQSQGYGRQNDRYSNSNRSSYGRNDDGRNYNNGPSRYDSSYEKDRRSGTETLDYSNSTAPPPPPSASSQSSAPLPVPVEPSIVVDEPVDEEALLEARRKKRAEIIAKYATASTSEATTPVAALVGSTPSDVGQSEKLKQESDGGREAETTMNPIARIKRELRAESELESSDEEVDTAHRGTKRVKVENDGDGIDSSTLPTRLSTPIPSSAAFELTKLPSSVSKPASSFTNDDMTLDDGADADQLAAQAEVEAGAEGDHNQAHLKEGQSIIIQDDRDRGQDEEEEEEDVDDDDDDDDDDMFSIGVPKEKKKKSTKKTVVKTATATTAAQPHNPLLQDNFDDADGYYNVLLGETLDYCPTPLSAAVDKVEKIGRYRVKAHAGRGMFSCVVRATDLLPSSELTSTIATIPGDSSMVSSETSGLEVAVKIIRSQESMYKAAVREIAILKRLRDADPQDKKHIVKLLRTFEWRGHLCLVFEGLSMNLREVIRKFGKDIGINLVAVRAYASQMFLALSVLKKCGIVHGDLKPDNILVNESKALLKICDLGSATDLSTAENSEATPYLVSRFYRAPEIILGLPYDCSVDTWSIGCTLYELYTGKILFPGRTNNHMLRLIMELSGKFSHKVIKKARFGEVHFDDNFLFRDVARDGTITPLALPPKATLDLSRRLASSSILKKMKDDEGKLVLNFVDLLEKMLAGEKGRRWGGKELLSHPFIR